MNGHRLSSHFNCTRDLEERSNEWVQKEDTYQTRVSVDIRLTGDLRAKDNPNTVDEQYSTAIDQDFAFTRESGMVAEAGREERSQIEEVVSPEFAEVVRGE